MKKAWNALLNISTALAAILALSVAGLIFMIIVGFAVGISKILIFVK